MNILEWIDELYHRIYVAKGTYQEEILLTTMEAEEIIAFLKNHVAMSEQA